MWWKIQSAALLLTWLFASLALSIPNCPFPGAAFPKPTNLASSSTVQAAVKNLTAAFQTYDSNPYNNPGGTSWSLQVFSASSDSPLWEHYHTATNLADVSVGPDTIYRLGSLTKIYTMLTFLAEAGDSYLNSPVTKYVPELQQLAAKAQSDPVMNVDWDSITLGNLASHMAGIMRDYAIEGELTQENTQSVLMSQGFPAAPAASTPYCGEAVSCSRAQLFAGLANTPPSFAPSQTPAYSNLGFQLLAYALENITKRSFAQMLQTDIIHKLGLNHTYYVQVPPHQLGVVPPGNELGWNYSLGESSPTGNMYSSISDLSALGRAIFRNSVLSAVQTRRWLKPAATTAEIYEGVSLPWGYRRVPLGAPGTGLENRIVDAYSKAGSINQYASLIVLLPDYDVGFAALLAGGWPGNANWDMADAIGPILLPALETAAREQADGMYAGTYRAAGSLNSSITLSTDPQKPGLGVDHWVSNGTDMIPVAIRYTLNYNVTGPSVRLFPTGLESGAAGGGTKVAFKAMIENTDAPDRRDKMFSTNCGTWVSQTVAVYADYPLDQFVFTIGSNGKVVSVEPLALRSTLEKQA
ncbi:beta-lactamase/transpeptidase-like protein [Xylariaceae sp. FL1651]|nr:beta-lactamase/transpeptidase-like protein [Xylariaceae sp. FL1651]